LLEQDQRTADPKTGELVHKFLDTENIANEFHRFASKQELLDLLELVKIESTTNQLQPFVHFDCHGNENGIGIVKTDGTEEFMPWSEIQDSFIEIFQASKKRSVICFSSCEGFNAVKMVGKQKPCPYDHISGSFKKVGFAEAYEDYAEFYTGIANGKEIFQSAVDVHNDPTYRAVEFMAVNSSTLFELMMKGYQADQLKQDVLDARKARLLSLLKLTFPHPNREQLNALDYYCSVQGQQVLLENFKEIFFSLN